MVELSQERATEPIPLNTSLESLVGTQCILSYVRFGGEVRCQRVADVVVMLKCEKCGQGGLNPVCKGHGELLLENYARMPGTCTQCFENVMVMSEPVELPTEKPVEAPVVVNDAGPEFWEMDW